ncbi:uncharacterized protein LOC110977907 isoform X2 [Acanthaster planci]|uniref:Uncharacterized protein LOC110977907 isoform X2 n=1 Tax=Acanthaster planci TaxID=133434 RepID=A0A8B7Y721_ACAPL|nr:uncharacterized protein LOC110977907 isoform X2 [Acanthaster planci]
MNAKNSSRKRESVFKAHVLEKLYPSEATVQDKPPPQETATKTELERSAGSVPTRAKLYTVHPPPGGLLQTLARNTSEMSEKRLKSSCSESESSNDSQGAHDRPVRKRKRKKKHGQRVREKVPCDTAEVDSPLTKGEDTQPQVSPTKSSSQPTTADASLTKNQRRKLRKKRAKLGRLQDRAQIQAEEFTVDVNKQSLIGKGDDRECEDESTQEVVEFLEAVWRVFSSDGSKTEIKNSITQPFQTMIDKMSNGKMSKETVNQMRDIKKLLVLQDFRRAQMKLTECLNNQASTSESAECSKVGSYPSVFTNGTTRITPLP